MLLKWHFREFLRIGKKALAACERAGRPKTHLFEINSYHSAIDLGEEGGGGLAFRGVRNIEGNYYDRYEQREECIVRTPKKWEQMAPKNIIWAQMPIGAELFVFASMTFLSLSQIWDRA